jgi:hypothetical protein
MQFLRPLAGAFIGAAIGGLVWIAIGYFAEAEVGYVAWGIGFLAGIGGAIGAGHNGQSAISGVAAVVAAVLVIAGAKYMVVSLLVDKAFEETVASEELRVTEESMIVGIADEVVGEFETAGKRMAWPPGMSVELAESQKDYPPDVWAEASKRWSELGADEQQRQIAEREEFMQQLMGAFTDDIRGDAFKESFSPFDLLWFGLAAFTAFRLGSGGVEE